MQLQHYSLYLSSMMRLPSGIPWDYRPDKNGVFRRRCTLPNHVSRGEAEYVLWTAKELPHVESYFTTGGHGVLGNMRNFRYDMVDRKTRTAYSYAGCYFHPHPQDCTQPPPRNDISIQREKEFVKADEYARRLGYRHVIMRECEWSRRKKADPELRAFIDKYVTPKGVDGGMTQTVLLRRIREKKLFGVAVVDLQNERTDDYLDEFGPVIAHREIQFQEIGPTTQKYVRDNEQSEKSRRALVSQRSAQCHFVSSDMLAYLMELGITVTKVHRFVQYIPTDAVSVVTNEIINKRKEADSNPVSRPYADAMKLSGNSIFGSDITTTTTTTTTGSIISIVTANLSRIEASTPTSGS